MNLHLVIGGGQTGADQGGLEFAIVHGIPHGGWCPKGRICEDGIIPSRYRLVETDTTDYRLRTKLNVLASDGTVIIHRAPLSGGSRLTRDLCSQHRRAFLLIDFGQTVPEAAVSLRQWAWQHGIKVLNVAGSRESKCHGVRQFTVDVLTQAYHSDS